jgi:hypothetical protein
MLTYVYIQGLCVYIEGYMSITKKSGRDRAIEGTVLLYTLGMNSFVTGQPYALACGL